MVEVVYTRSAAGGKKKNSGLPSGAYILVWNHTAPPPSRPKISENISSFFSFPFIRYFSVIDISRIFHRGGGGGVGRG
jgi:hypothetical protein